MPEFAGFNDWIEIFRGGKQVDSNGVSHDGDALIERAVSQFDAAEHEPPLVVGHPRDNSPAFGWVEGLKTALRGSSKVLLAKCRQVVPEFEGLVRQGVYKKRSAAFYPDGRLRHVGFLGGVPPAVKGLADIGFAEAAGSVFEFTENRWTWQSVARLFRNFRDWMIETAGLEKADAVLPDYAIEEIAAAGRETPSEIAPGSPGFTEEKKEAVMKFSEFMEIFKFWKQVENDPAIELPKPVGAASVGAASVGAASSRDNQAKTFSEAEVAAQVDAAKKQAEADARKAVAAEFAEAAKKAAADTRKAALKSWYDENLKAGKLAPAWGKLGLLEFMQGLDSVTEIQFAEGVKTSPAEFMKKFIAELPKVIEFSEIARRDKDVAGDAGGKLDQLIKARREKEPKLTFSEALTAVQLENPELAREYADSVGAPKQ